jgi:hypothetical protein
MLGVADGLGNTTAWLGIWTLIGHMLESLSSSCLVCCRIVTNQEGGGAGTHPQTHSVHLLPQQAANFSLLHAGCVIRV